MKNYVWVCQQQYWCWRPDAAKEPPTQVVYRFDDHRYLELKGWDCEGELWFSDTKKGIHSQIASQFYRIFTKNSCILQSTILLFRGGEMLLVVFQYQKTMGKRGKEVVHLCHQGAMNLMEVTLLIMMMLYLSPSSAIRAFTDQTPAVYVVKTI